MAYNKPVLSGFNSNPPADDGSEVASNEIRWVTHVNKLGNPLKQYADAINNAVEALFDGNQIDTVNLGSGTADTTVFLRGDGSWSATLTGGITLNGDVAFPGSSTRNLTLGGNTRFQLTANTAQVLGTSGSLRVGAGGSPDLRVTDANVEVMGVAHVVGAASDKLRLHRSGLATDTGGWVAVIGSSGDLRLRLADDAGNSSAGDVWASVFRTGTNPDRVLIGPRSAGVTQSRLDLNEDVVALGTTSAEVRVGAGGSPDLRVTSGQVDVTGDADVSGNLDVTGSITGDFTEGGLGTYAMVGSNTVGGPAFDWGDTTSGSNLRPVNTNASTTSAASSLSGTWRIMSAGLVTTTGPSIDSGGLAVRIA